MGDMILGQNNLHGFFGHEESSWPMKLHDCVGWDWQEETFPINTFIPLYWMGRSLLSQRTVVGVMLNSKHLVLYLEVSNAFSFF
jgi:hypothetical protein